MTSKRLSIIVSVILFIAGFAGIALGQINKPVRHHKCNGYNPSKIQSRFVPANPVVEQQKTELKSQELQNLTKDLRVLKRKFLGNVKDNIDSALRQRYSSDHQKTIIEHLSQIDTELEKPEADLAKVERWLNETDQAILKSFGHIINILAKQEDTEVSAWKKLLVIHEVYLGERDTVLIHKESQELLEKIHQCDLKMIKFFDSLFPTDIVNQLETAIAHIQSTIGKCYYNGKGTKQNYVEAVKWLRKTAEQGDVAAQRYLGFCYLEGWGVSKDSTEAAKWYRKVAEQGNNERK